MSSAKWNKSTRVYGSYTLLSLESWTSSCEILREIQIKVSVLLISVIVHSWHFTFLDHRSKQRQDKLHRDDIQQRSCFTFGFSTTRVTNSSPWGNTSHQLSRSNNRNMGKKIYRIYSVYQVYLIDFNYQIGESSFLIFAYNSYSMLKTHQQMKTNLHY